VVSGVRRDTRPFWPDEDPSVESTYPWRIEIASPIPMGRVQISPERFTTAEAVAIRSSAIQPAPVRLAGTPGALLRQFSGLTSSPEGLVAQMQASAPSSTTVRSRAEQVALFGRDPERNRVVERRAVDVSSDWLRGKGWSVVSREKDNVGFDLECRLDDSLLHVEVKGTSGTGDEVLVSRNEVRFAQENPETAALFIVAEIRITSDAEGLPQADGGDLIHSGKWTNLQNGLTPTGFTYAHQP
jgi:hypothetical protein